MSSTHHRSSSGFMDLRSREERKTKMSKLLEREGRTVNLKKKRKVDNGGRRESVGFDEERRRDVFG